MKKILIFLIISALLLASCSTNDSEPSMDQDVQEGTAIDDVQLDQNQGDMQGDTDSDLNQNETEELDTPAVLDDDFELETYDVEDIILEKRLGNYHFEDSGFVSDQEFLGYNFDFYNGEYIFDEISSSFVSVLVPRQGIVSANLLEDIDASDDYVFLDNKDFDFLNADVYYNVKSNTYLWMSKGKIILIKESIGYDLLNKYLEKYPVSVIKGIYDEEFSIEFEGDHDEKIVIFNDNQYVLELEQFDSDEITFVVNDEEVTLESGDNVVVGNLLIEVSSIDFSNKKLDIIVKKEVFELETFNLGLGDQQEFDIGGTHSIKLLAVNSDDMSAMIAIDGVSKSFEQNQLRTIKGFEVTLSNMFINTIGEETVDAEIKIWEE